MTTESSQVSQVLLVGSSPVSTNTEFFKRAVAALPGRLHRIPDGETGNRSNFIAWQYPVFPIETVQPRLGGQPSDAIDGKIYDIADIQPTGYDDQAAASYREFCSLRKTGNIAAGIRFQVCLPTPLSVVRGFIETRFCSSIEPLYEQRMVEAMRNLQENIPASDLSLQIDLPLEIAILEFEHGRLEDPYFKPYFKPVKAGIVDRISRMVSAVGSDVELGFHFCYGDLGHEHFVQPTDTFLLVGLANDVMEAVTPIHSVHYIHLPVPKDRTDEAYYRPLQKLDLESTQLFLGLVHANDETGTKERIGMAKQVYQGDFGISSECGLGRTSVEDMESILEICSTLTVATA